ncbi:MAG: helix-turn-helix domain-containing protein [Chryseolinea sp.]
MILQSDPHPALQHFIKRITLIRYQLDTSRPRPVNPFPPQPENCLFFYPYDKVTCRNYADGRIEELPRSILVGPQLSRVDLTIGYNMLVIMVSFHPGAMHRLLHIPMDEMLGRPFDATLILGREIEQITERLNEETEFNAMINIIQQYLFQKTSVLKNRLPIEKVITQMIQHKNYLNVDQLAKQACVSIRQLERQFKERTGMPPKVFLRLVRFSKAWIMREKNNEISWAKIAHACDYADQMHMIRDFKDFAGVSPGVLQTDLGKSSLRLQGTTID